MARSDHQVLRLWTRPASKAAMVEHQTLTLESDLGIAGDAAYGKSRHVTIVFLEDWNAAARALGRPVDPVGRRANVLVSGGQGLRSSGQRIRLGACLLEIHGETRPCNRMEDAAPGLLEALRPGGRAGIWGRVLEGGTLRVGDRLEAVDAATGARRTEVG